MNQTNNPFAPAPVPQTTLCKCCNELSKLVAVVDAARSGSDTRAGYAVDALAGRPLYYYRCQSCGFTFTRGFDHWTRDDFARNIYNEEYSRHDPSYANGERGVRTAADIFTQFGAFAPKLSVLDWGSGEGSFCAELRRYGFARVEGYDPFVKESSVAPAGLYDMVTCFEVIEHELNPTQLIEKMAAHRSKNGAILISTLLCTQQVVDYGLENWHYCVPRGGHISFMTALALMLCAKRVGLVAHSFSAGAHVIFDEGCVPEWLAPVLPALQKENLADLKSKATIPEPQKAAAEVRSVENTFLSQPSNVAQSNAEFNRVVKSRHGTLMFNRFDKYVGGSLAAYGEFSEGEAVMFAQLVGPGHVVVEAGANIGAHTIHLAKLVGDQGAIFAFEPQRAVFQTLCANLALNQLVNVVARQQGVGKHAGEMVMPNADPRIENNFGGMSLMQNGAGEKTNIVTIDSLNLARCNLIKADVEGMEEEVITGAINTIAKFRPLLYLENDRAEKSASLLRMLQSLKYRMWWHITPLFNPDNFARNTENIFPGVVSINILCQPSESAKQVQGLHEIVDVNEKWKMLNH
jgi:FkbM family methyltransferase